MTKEQKLREVVFLYIEAMAKLTLCRQDHFKQLCHTCKEYAKCLIYENHVDTWMNLQKACYPEKTVEPGDYAGVVTATRKLAKNTKDEALSITLDALCSIIEQQQKELVELKETE